MRLDTKHIQQKEAATHSAFFAKESENSFFGGTDPFFANPAVQTKPTNNQSDDKYEQEPDSSADKLVQHLSGPASEAGTSNQLLSNNNLAVQHRCDECEQEEKIQKKEDASTQQNAPAVAPSPPSANEPSQNIAAATTHVSVAGHIVDDNSIPESGQMRKTVFLEKLKTEVCETVNQALAGTVFSSDNCPYIRASFGRHQNSSPAQIEALIIRYCPAAAQAHSAEEMIQRMKIKVHAAALQWAHNGSDLSGVSQIFGGVASSVASGIGKMVSGVAGMFFKENTGGARATQSPQAVMQSLGKGNSIEGGTRSKMEGAFGTGFSDVEIHTDSNAAQLSKDMNARAFTVGNHIAFGGGEYQPGTLAGDALMAHELAHTIQQDNGKADDAQMKGGAGYNALEEDADSTAVNVMTKLTGRNDLQLKNKVDKGLKTGLQLQRCGDGGKKCTITSKLADAQPDGGVADVKTVEVNQKVEFTASTSATWSATDGTFAAPSGTTAIWTAPKTVGNFIITAKPSSGSPCTAEVQVVDTLYEEFKKKRVRPPADLLPAQSIIRDSAVSLGTNAVVMDSYERFQSKEVAGGELVWGFFFSKDKTLNGATRRPSAVDTWKHFNALNSVQKATLFQISRITGEVIHNRYSENDAVLEKLKKAYAYWPSGYYAVHQSGSAEATNTCNVFVGGSLHGAGFVGNNGGKLWSAAQVYAGADGSFTEIDKAFTQPGDIVAYGHHVGVVVTVDVDNRKFITREGYIAVKGSERERSFDELLGREHPELKVMRKR